MTGAFARRGWPGRPAGPPAIRARRVRPHRPLLGASFAAWLIAGAADPAAAYRYYPEWDVLAAEAVRWRPDDFPLRFHLQDNVPEFLDGARWREIVQGALGQWSAIPSAEVSLRLAPGLTPPAAGGGAFGDGADANDGRFTIGWLPPDGLPGPLAYAVLTWSDRRRMTSCDIVFVTATFMQLAEAGVTAAEVERVIRTTILHEVGHCLGLNHTEPAPVWQGPNPDLPGASMVTLPVAGGFRPDTVMSYALSRPLRLSEDDIVGVSLLYPAPGFLESRGAVAGDVVRGPDPSIFAYVQAVYPGAEPRLGPGAYASKTGHFRLSGLRPGPVLLWIHPLLIHGPVAQAVLLQDIYLASRDPASLDILDQWQWVRIEAGTVVGLPASELVTGRSQ